MGETACKLPDTKCLEGKGETIWLLDPFRWHKKRGMERPGAAASAKEMSPSFRGSQRPLFALLFSECSKLLTWLLVLGQAGESGVLHGGGLLRVRLSAAEESLPLLGETEGAEPCHIGP